MILNIPTLCKDGRPGDFWLVLVGLLLSVATSSGYNVDIKTALVHKKDPGSMFGFAVAQHVDQGQHWLLVGAPKAQTSQLGVEQGGAVYRCRVDEKNCHEIPFDQQGNEHDWQWNRQIEEKSHQWFGATVHSSGINGVIVACAPRYVYYTRYLDQREPIGGCYVVRSDTTHFKKYAPCKGADVGYHRKGFCQAGFSAALAADGSRLIMGSVGSYYWQGQVFSQNLFDDQDIVETVESSEHYDNSYMGYALAMGEFDGDRRRSDYVVGIPRGHEDLTGKVAIYTEDLRNLENITGTQLGEYFGNSIAVADFNGDGLDDIAVGAPFYSDNSSNAYESGRVYVHLQNSHNSFYPLHRRMLHGNGRVRARFGFALSSLRDIDGDGYQDLAVGAPYDGTDGRGAVYIYQGSRHGIRQEASQIIYSTDIGSSPSTFGFSLSGGSDLDNNEYPDLLVGAYQSAQAVFLRTRPVVWVKPTVQLEPNMIILEVKRCTRRNGKEVTCFSIRTCVEYTGVRLPQEIDMKLIWKLDANNNRSERAFFLEHQETETRKEVNVRIQRGKPQCSQHTAYIKDDIRDKLSPISVQLTYDMMDPPVRYNQYRTLTPVLHAYTPTTVIAQAQIQKNCGPDEVCLPDLALKASSLVSEHVIGSETKLEISVEVNNYGEDAFEAHVRLPLPDGVDYVNVHSQQKNHPIKCLSLPDTEEDVLLVLCDIGNPLGANEKVTFTLITSAGQVNVSAGALVFHLEARSANPEQDADLHNNLAVVKVPIVAEVKLLLIGVSKPEQVLYNSTIADKIESEEDIGPELTHLYEVRNLGPSPLTILRVQIQWPSVLEDGRDVLYLPEMPKVTKGRGTCTAESIDPRQFSKNQHTTSRKDRSKRDAEEVIIKEMLCEPSGPKGCTTISCQIQNMEKDDNAVIQIRSRVFTNTFIQMQTTFSAVTVGSYAKAQVVEGPQDVPNGRYSMDTNSITTYIAAIDAVPEAEALQYWIVILSVSIGCLIFLIIVLVLWKIGFFKRKRVEDMEPLKPAPNNRDSAASQTRYDKLPAEEF